MYRRLLLLALAGFCLLLFAAPQPVASQDPLQAPEVSTGSIQAGCYLDSPGVCKIHVEPFTIITGSARTLETITFKANNLILYALGADDQHAPTGSITPSAVRADFAAHCNLSYTVTVEAKDSGDTNPVLLGTTRQFSCPVWTYKANMPLLTRP